MDDIDYMRRALELARIAYELEETPIGAVIVLDDQIIGIGYNRRNTAGNALCHAEMDAISMACRRVGDWRLERCTIYITLEPCPMCAGAIIQARIPRAVIGAMNPKAGCAGSVCNLLQNPSFNHQVDVTYGVLETESRTLMQQFFAQLRMRDKQRKEEAKKQHDQI